MYMKLKKSLIAATVLATAFTGAISYTYAQDSTGARSMDGHVIMRDNKMYVMREVPMDRDMTMANGHRVDRSGNIFMKDGTKRMFRNGERMDPTGNFGKAGID